MADDGWQGMSHQEIVSKLSGLKVDTARAEADRWSNVYQHVSDSLDTAMKVRSKLLDTDSWSGDAANAAYDAVDRTYKKIANPDTGLAAEAGKLGQAADQDAETLIAAGRVPQNYPVPDKNASKDQKQQALNAIRSEAQRVYTDPMSANRPKVTDPDVEQLGSGPGDQGGGGNGGGGNGGGGSGSGTQTPSATDGLASKDTKPQLAGGEGQQAGAGQGQGQGAGQGGGAGGGQGSGSGGSGSGSGLGSGLGSGSGGSGLPLGSTTAAGFSPSSTGTGGVGGGGSATGLSGPGGLSALRGGGLPGGAVGGAGSGGINPAAMGASGVRGGPMGMMGGAGGHGRGGKGEEDEERPIPSFLINVDNGNELFGESIKASPGVIGDWSENEEAEKKAREAEIRRYKSMGWDVKFE